MMAFYSYNGWEAAADRRLIGVAPLRIADAVDLVGGVRSGDVAYILGYVAEQLHKRVETGSNAFRATRDGGYGCWGFAYRLNRNANNFSCHASGTAFDWNATRHANGARNTFSSAQVAEIRKILSEVGGVVRWGGDFSGTPDEMHFEIKGNAEAVARAADELRIRLSPPPPPPPAALPERAPDSLPVLRRGDESGWVYLLQECVGSDRDGRFGPGTEADVKVWQKAHNLVADGNMGNRTWMSFIYAAGNILSRGSAPGHPGIEVLQNVLGLRGSDLDRLYGPQVEGMVIQTQRWGRVVPDGRVGPQTREVLFGKRY